MASLLAPKLSAAPDIPFHSYQPNLSVSGHVPPPESPQDSALGVLAQVAHELDRPIVTVDSVGGDYFSNPNALPHDLADTLIHLFYPI